MTGRKKRAAQQDMAVATAARLLSEKAKEKRQRAKQRRDELKQVGSSLLFRYRAQLAPLGLLGLLWLAGMGLSGQPVGRALVVGIVGCAVALFRLRRKLDRRDEQVYALACCVAVVAWLVACATVGPVRWVAVPGVLAWFWAAWLWWQHHGVRETPNTAAEPSSLEQWWEQADLFPGSRLENVEPIDNGVTATIVVPPGKAATTAVIRAAETIASARETSLTTTLVEPTRDRVANRAQLTLLRSSQVDSVHSWPGPQLDPTTGIAPVGPYADQGLALARFWRPGSGPVHWMVCGVTNGGKSRYLDWTILEAAHSGLIATWVGDPQGGQSLPAWRDAVHRYEDSPTGIVEMLRCLEAEMDARSRELSRAEWIDEDGRTWVGKGSFDPTPEMPILQAVIDEAQDILEVGSDVVKLAARIARKGRKAGIRLVLATHVPSVDQLGGSMTLRAQVVAGGVAALRTAENVTNNMVLPRSFPVNPYDLPAETAEGDSTAGTLYVLGPQPRPVPARNWFVPNAHRAAASAPKIPLWLRSVTPATVRVPASAPPDHPRLFDVTASDPDAQPSDSDGQQSSCRDAILALPWDQHPELTRAQIHDAIQLAGVNVGLSAVQKALGALVEDGQLERAGHGQYRRTGAMAA